jgi:hypothetical protein
MQTQPNLADPDDVAVPESGGTGFSCYGMALGINHDLLDPATYLPVVKRAWAGLVKSISPEGKVRWGQPVGDRPAAVKEELTHEYVSALAWATPRCRAASQRTKVLLAPIPHQGKRMSNRLRPWA